MRRRLSTRRAHRGFLLVGLLVLLVTGVLIFAVTVFGPEAVEARRTQKTEAALAEAREALIGYALQYRDQQIAAGTDDAMYGYLPLPDVGSSRNNNVDPICHLGGDPALAALEGCDAAWFAGISYDANGMGPTVAGRFPWRKLGTGPIRDGYGECLWLLVSSSHDRILRSSPPATPPAMNWDSLGQLDVVIADGADSLRSVVASAHDRPVAIVFSPGPPLSGQDRSASAADDVTQCGGNYNPANYLDPNVADTLRDATGAVTAGASYFAGGTTTDTSATNMAVSTQSDILGENDGNLWQDNCPAGTNCARVADDRGLALTSDSLFDNLRNNGNYRTDINSLLDRIVESLRDQGVPGGFQKIPGANDNPWYGRDVVPRGYYPNYREMIFVASGTPQVNGMSCAGVLLFASQRGTKFPPPVDALESRFQVRTTDPVSGNNATANTAWTPNYLEGVNLTTSGPFSGQEQFERVSTMQTISQDIVRCIPSTPSFVTTQSPGLAAAGLPQLAGYSPPSRTLTLGQTVESELDSSLADFLYGCAWTPEAHTSGSGLRSYFTFRINDSGFSFSPHEGFVFAIVDGDNNGTGACGAAAQHIGYSGNNAETTFLVPPKVGVEFDLRRVSGDSGFDPSDPNHLANGRNDPSTSSSAYRGGHIAITYWGGEAAINTTIASPPACTPPSFNYGGVCYLPQEEDDNVHGQFPTTRAGFASPPANPAAPSPPLSVPPDTPAGVYKLDPNRTSIPVNQDFHVRVELTRSTSTDFNLPRVRLATTASIDLTSPYIMVGENYHFAIDGVFLFDGDRVLVKDQFDAALNGVYVWRATTPPTMVRAEDADTSVELAGLMTEVQQGVQNAHAIWRQNDIDPVPGTDALLWTNIRVKVAAPATINIASPGTTIDGIRMSVGDRVLVRSVGVYVWRGATIAMTPAPDVGPGSAIQVQQGSEAPAWWQFDGATWWRLAVRTATQAALDLNNPGANIGGVTLVSGDRILVKNQTNSAENGIYVWLGAATSMNRAADADSAQELAGALTQVLDGFDASRTFRQNTLTASGALDAQTVHWEGVDRSSTYLLEAWVLPESEVYNNMIAAMQDTTRPMSQLYPGFTPHLRDAPLIPYPFRNVRLGFTTGQRTTVTDQTISIRDSFTTWLP